MSEALSARPKEKKTVVQTAGVIDRDLEASGFVVLASAPGGVALAQWAFVNRGGLVDGTLHVTVDRLGRKAFSFYAYNSSGTAYRHPTLVVNATDIVSVQTVRNGFSRVVQVTVGDAGTKARTTTFSVVSSRGSMRRLFDALGFIL